MKKSKVLTQSQETKNYIKAILRAFPDAFLQFTPKAIAFSLASIPTKWNYRKLTDLQKISKEGLVHVTRNKESQQAIMESGYLHGVAGKKRFFFAGVPTLEQFGMQCYGSEPVDLLQEPTKIMYGVRVRATEEQTKRLIYRPYYDDSVIYKGEKHSPNFAFAEVEPVQLCLDVAPGKTGEMEPFLRERTKAEMIESPERHIPSPELKEYLSKNTSCLVNFACKFQVGKRYIANKRAFNYGSKSLLRCVTQGIKYDLRNAFEKTKDKFESMALRKPVERFRLVADKRVKDLKAVAKKIGNTITGVPQSIRNKLKACTMQGRVGDSPALVMGAKPLEL